MTETDLNRLHPVTSSAEPAGASEAASPRPPAPAAKPREVRRFEVVDVRPVRGRLPGAAQHDLTFEGPPSSAEREEVYFDTTDWRLHRAGYTLRFVLQEGEEHAVLTAVGTGDAARSALDVAHPASLMESFLAGSGTAADRVRALIGTRRLQRLFSLRSRVETFALRLGDVPAGEIRLIETSVPVPGDEAPVRFSRAEIVTMASTPDGFHRFAQELHAACGLRPAALTDREAGLLAAGLTPPGAWSFGSTAVDRSTSIAALAFAVLREQFSRVLAHEPGTRIGVDIEQLHDMRVAVRRMRAAFSVFGPFLPERAQPLAFELRWLGKALGEVRDLDVQIAQLAGWRASFEPAERIVFQPIERALQDQRYQARARMLSELDSSRFENLVARMSTFLKEGPDPTNPAGRALAVMEAPRLVEARFDRVMRKGKKLKPSSDPEQFHRVRIHAKVLRYVLEFHSGLYGSETRRMISRLQSVQDVLGRHQDADFSVARIRVLARDGEKLPAATVFLLGRLCERYDREAARLRRRFPKLLRKLDGRRWKRLSQTMHEAAGLPTVEPAERAEYPY